MNKRVTRIQEEFDKHIEIKSKGWAWVTILSIVFIILSVAWFILTTVGSYVAPTLAKKTDYKIMADIQVDVEEEITVPEYLIEQPVYARSSAPRATPAPLDYMPLMEAEPLEMPLGAMPPVGIWPEHEAAEEEWMVYEPISRGETEPIVSNDRTFVREPVGVEIPINLSTDTIPKEDPGSTGLSIKSDQLTWLDIMERIILLLCKLLKEGAVFVAGITAFYGAKNGFKRKPKIRTAT